MPTPSRSSGHNDALQLAREAERTAKDVERRLNVLETRTDERHRQASELIGRLIVQEERGRETREDLAEIKADLKSSRALIRSVFITAAVSVIGQIVVFAVTRT